MKKLLIILTSVLFLLLSGCADETLVGGLPADLGEAAKETTLPSDEASQDPTSGSFQETTEPLESKIFYLKEQTYLDANGTPVVKLTTDLNDKGLPESVSLKSGKSVTHTVSYDEDGMISSFKQLETLYDEEQTTTYKVNSHGDVVIHTTNAGTQQEVILESVYVYDDQGRVLQMERTQNGRFYCYESMQYDQEGNLLTKETRNADNVITKLTNTYENGLLVKSEETVDGTLKQTVTYTYDDSENLIKKNINDTEIHNYTYSETGVLKKLIVAKGTNMNVCEYDEYGNITLQQNYTDGVITSEIIYIWEAFSTQPTDAQMNVYDQLGIV